MLFSMCGSLPNSAASFFILTPTKVHVNIFFEFFSFNFSALAGFPNASWIILSKHFFHVNRFFIKYYHTLYIIENAVAYYVLTAPAELFIRFVCAEAQPSAGQFHY